MFDLFYQRRHSNYNVKNTAINIRGPGKEVYATPSEKLKNQNASSACV